MSMKMKCVLMTIVMTVFVNVMTILNIDVETHVIPEKVMVLVVVMMMNVIAMIVIDILIGKNRMPHTHMINHGIQAITFEAVYNEKLDRKNKKTEN